MLLFTATPHARQCRRFESEHNEAIPVHDTISEVRQFRAQSSVGGNEQTAGSWVPQSRQTGSDLMGLPCLSARERTGGRFLAMEGWQVEDGVQHSVDRVVPCGLFLAINAITDEIGGRGRTSASSRTPRSPARS